jgi:hypothetical protein
MSDKQINMDVDALLDGTLDDLADMPEFKAFPNGLHRCAIKMETKKIDGFTAVEVKLTAKETVELPAGSEEQPLQAGDNTNLLYFLNHKDPKVAEFGQGGFKIIMAAAAQHFGAKTNRELMADMNAAEVLVVTKKRSNKEKTQTYTAIDSIAVA